MEPTLQELAAQLAHAKHAESTAKDQRIQAEEAIISLLSSDLKERGATTKDAGNGLSVTVTTGLNYKVDFDKLASDAPELSDFLISSKVVHALDVKAYESLTDSDKAKAVACVSVTPKKTSVALKVK